jgi:hypothetical protein
LLELSSRARAGKEDSAEPLFNRPLFFSLPRSKAGNEHKPFDNSFIKSPLSPREREWERGL